MKGPTGKVVVGRTRHHVTPDGRHRTTATVHLGGKTRRLWFETEPGVPFLVHDVGDLWLPMLLLVAMRRRETLVLRDGFDQSRRAQLRELQRMYAGWYPDRFGVVKMAAPQSERTAPAVTSAGIGACFTGGIDSFDTLMRNEGRIDALVFGVGVDFPHRRHDKAQAVAADLAEVASAYGKRLLIARTNVRTLLDDYLDWERESHGSVLASLATLFSPVVSELLVPSSHPPDLPYGWGSHPIADGLRSTDRAAVVYEGTDDRSTKIERVTADQRAREHLRICARTNTARNCGRCLKCLRTMAVLTLLGRMDQMTTFDEPFSADRLRAKALKSDNHVFSTRRALEYAQQFPGHEEIKAAYQGQIDDYLAAHPDAMSAADSTARVTFADPVC